ncbi:MAG: RNA polymerase sigma-54 factor [Chlamydiales bacterium]|jgi:RNA polymerase sigma-54 factor
MSYSMSLNLQQKNVQSLKQTQRLIMSPQMQQAIHLLQMPVMELTTMIEAEMEQNPVLEYGEEIDPDDSLQQDIESEIHEENQDADLPVEEEITFDDQDFGIMRRLDEEFGDHFAESGGGHTKRSSDEEKLKSYMESSICAQSSLFEHLMAQARQSLESQEDLDLAEAIIGNLDQRGFLEMPLEEISLLYEAELSKVEEVLLEIQSFEPHGVGAVDVRESLLIQLAFQGKKDSIAYKIIEKHYEDLLYNRIPLIKKSLSTTADEIQKAVHEEIARLDLYPGTWYSNEVVPHVTADVIVSRENGKLLVSIDGETLPFLKLNSKYLKMLGDNDLAEETKEYIRNKVASGKWLLRNIHQRNDTLLKITEYLVKRQKNFFLDNKGNLLPLTMKTVAEELDLHESTVARAVSNKYVDCPRGLLPLRSFFTNAYVTDEGEISSRTVKDYLKDVIGKEDKNKPYSDETISALIKKKGIPCARRTVAKYRRELNIGNASQRRKYR